MAFNVCDREGKHLGITYGDAVQPGSFHMGHTNRRVIYIALTEQKIREGDLDYQKLKEGIASRHSLKTFTGKVKEEELQKELERYWQDEVKQMNNGAEDYQNLYRDYQPEEYNEEYLYRLFHLKNRFRLEPYWMGEELKIRGYLMYDLNQGILYDDQTLLLEEPVNYVNTEEEYEGLKPLHCVIADRPEVKISVMGTGEGLLFGASLSDLGGRNHVHYTKLKLLSGNYLYTTTVPLHIHGKEGAQLTMFVETEKNRFRAFICDGVLYTA